MSVDRRGQLRAAFAGEFSDQEKLLWVYLFTVGTNGEGKAKIAEALRWDENDVAVAAEGLISVGLLQRKIGRYRALHFALPSSETPDAPTTPPALADKVDAALRTYNDARVAAGVAPVVPTTDTRTKLTSLIEWLHDIDVRFEDFFEFARARSSFLREKTGLKVPAMSLLVGPWLRETWAEEHGVVVQKSTEHAGKKYEDPAGLKEKLAQAGFDKRPYTKGDLRYIMTSANNMIADPKHFPEPPEEFRKEVYWLKRQIEGGTTVAGS